jgi:hypothetical protein
MTIKNTIFWDVTLCSLVYNKFSEESIKAHGIISQKTIILIIAKDSILLAVRYKLCTVQVQIPLGASMFVSHVCGVL